MSIRVTLAADVECLVTLTHVDEILRRLADLDPRVFAGECSVVVDVTVDAPEESRARAVGQQRLADALTAIDCQPLQIEATIAALS
jgi:hypothetical protein